MTRKRKITTVVVIAILVAAVIFAVTRFLGGGSRGIDNAPEQTVAMEVLMEPIV